MADTSATPTTAELMAQLDALRKANAAKDAQIAQAEQRAQVAEEQLQAKAAPVTLSLKHGGISQNSKGKTVDHTADWYLRLGGYRTSIGVTVSQGHVPDASEIATAHKAIGDILLRMVDVFGAELIPAIPAT